MARYFGIDFSLSVLWLLLSIGFLIYMNYEPAKPFERECADIFFSGGTIWTGTDNDQHVEAVSVKGKNILSVGSLEEVSKTYCPDITLAVPLDGKMLVPGWIDSHVHGLLGGMDLLSVQLFDCDSFQMMADRVEEFITKMQPGEWLVGSGWNQERFLGDEAGILPDRHLIDKVAPNNPVWLCRLDQHQCLANTLALELANVDLTSPPDIPGGVFQMDEETGLATGIVKDSAMAVIVRAIPTVSDEKLQKGLQTAMNYFVAHGVTSVNQVVNDIFTDLQKGWDTFEQLYESTKPGQKNIDGSRSLYAIPFVRTYFAPALALYKDAYQLYVSKQYLDSSFLRLGAVKGFLDGSLGSYTAKMFLPYKDNIQGGPENNTGMYLTTKEDLYTWVKESDELGLQVFIHAIGDEAVNTILNTYERIMKESPKEDRRFRIEHCQHMIESDYDRLSELGVIASVQPYHLIDDAIFINRTLGVDRLTGAYPFKTLLGKGSILSFGSDWNVAPASPILGIHAAVTRSYLDMEGNRLQFVPEECITVEQGLHAYTTAAAFAERTEHVKGYIKKGYYADLVVIDQVITEIDPNDIPNTNVDLTVIDGQIVYQSDKLKLVQPALWTTRNQ